jgi:hypothetical protein
MQTADSGEAWQSRTTPVGSGSIQTIILSDSGNDPLNYCDVIGLWRSNKDFRTWFVALLSNAPFDAFRFETPPVSIADTERPFEFVLVDSPSLDRPASRHAFQKQFDNTNVGDHVLTFSNLGGDALMVVPCPLAGDDAYCHLAGFSRCAPAEQQDALWRAVGEAMAEQLCEWPIWLSTAGGGVPWLHVRLDERPKYYSHAPYRNSGI